LPIKILENNLAGSSSARRFFAREQVLIRKIPPAEATRLVLTDNLDITD
jgi:hypothetical protein